VNWPYHDPLIINPNINEVYFAVQYMFVFILPKIYHFILSDQIERLYSVHLHMLTLTRVFVLYAYESFLQEGNDRYLLTLKVSSKSTCVTVTMQRVSLVAASQPAVIKLYDYYKPGTT